MQAIPIAKYIHFGEVERWLLGVEKGYKIHGEGGVLRGIVNFFEYLKQFNLPVTLRASGSLIEFMKKLSKSKTDSLMTEVEAAELTLIMGNLEKTLNAEAGGNVAYIVTDSRIDVNKLLSDVGSLMAPNVFNLLPDIASYDFSEAGKCIAFERPTAAAFHLLRGTEDVLRRFYCSFVKKGRVSDLVWGKIVNHLKQLNQKKYRKKKVPEPLLQNLDNIRFSFRNPTQHPDKIYDIQEVQDLFGLCIDVVNRMIALL